MTNEKDDFLNNCWDDETMKVHEEKLIPNQCYQPPEREPSRLAECTYGIGTFGLMLLMGFVAIIMWALPIAVAMLVAGFIFKHIL
jgi:hypothetical protein